MSGDKDMAFGNGAVAFVDPNDPSNVFGLQRVESVAVAHEIEVNDAMNSVGAKVYSATSSQAFKINIDAKDWSQELAALLFGWNYAAIADSAALSISIDAWHGGAPQLTLAANAKPGVYMYRMTSATAIEYYFVGAITGSDIEMVSSVRTQAEVGIDTFAPASNAAAEDWGFFTIAPAFNNASEIIISSMSVVPEVSLVYVTNPIQKTLAIDSFFAPRAKAIEPGFGSGRGEYVNKTIGFNLLYDADIGGELKVVRRTLV